jgi:peptidoglycan-N-acetylglucosamine deacetylase
MPVALGICVVASTLRAAEPDPFGIIIRPIPEKMVVLSFDDSCRSHATFVAPLLKKYGFGATFYITEFGGGPFADKTMYMTWEQIKGLHEMGFEVGNHTLGHGGLSGSSPENCLAAAEGIEARCLANGIPKPTTFCWPMYNVSKWGYKALSEAGYIFSRGGHERTYRPAMDAPLDVPSFTIHDASLQNPESFADAAKQATAGRFVVYTFHGVPDVEHPTVGVEPAKFEALIKYLKDNRYTVISVRDMARYVDVEKAAKFLPFPMTQPWGGMLRDGNRVYVTVSNIPADRKVTLSSMTTKIGTAYFLEDEKKTALVVETSDAGIQTIMIPESPLAGRPDYPTVIVADLQGGPVATIIDFQFPGAGEGVIVGNEIHVKCRGRNKRGQRRNKRGQRRSKRGRAWR